MKWSANFDIVHAIELIIILALAAGLFLEVRSWNTQKAAYQKELNSITAELQKKPKVVTQYVKIPNTITHTITQTVVVPEQSVPTQVKISKEAYCKTAHDNGVEPEVDIANGMIDCKAYFCLNTGTITILKPGQQVIEKRLQRSLWHWSFGAGYNLYGSQFLLSASPIDYHGLIGGADVLTDFKSFKSSDFGVYAGWRPDLWSFTANFAVGVGAMVNYKGQVLPQAFIEFLFLDAD